MNTKQKLTAAVLFGTAAVLMLAGCSGQSARETASSPEQASETVVSAAETAAGSGTLPFTDQETEVVPFLLSGELHETAPSATEEEPASEAAAAESAASDDTEEPAASVAEAAEDAVSEAAAAESMASEDAEEPAGSVAEAAEDTVSEAAAAESAASEDAEEPAASVAEAAEDAVSEAAAAGSMASDDMEEPAVSEPEDSEGTMSAAAASGSAEPEDEAGSLVSGTEDMESAAEESSGSLNLLMAGGTARDAEDLDAMGAQLAGESACQWATRKSVEEMTRMWRREALDKEDAVRRSRRESLLKDSMLARYKSDHDGSAPDDMKVYYVCTDGTDYIAVDDGSETPDVYLACITKSGEYFVSTEEISEAAVSTVSKKMTEENLSSSEEFWNKITLLDMPEGTIFGLSQRPVDENGVMMVPYFNQGAGYYEGGTWTHTDWPNAAFAVNGHTMHQAGCGFFSTAMALSYLLEDTISPVDFKENGQYIANEGSAVTVGVVTAHLYGVPAYTTGDWGTVVSALKNGHPVMEHVGPSVFTKAGHYIVLVGVLPDGSIAVNDPGHTSNTYWYNHVVFRPETILAAAKDRGTAFTIFG